MEALKGVRILDMTHVQAGPTCSQLLAWLGADVIKFRIARGRRDARPVARRAERRTACISPCLNCKIKRSITVNIEVARGKGEKAGVRRASEEGSDIVMENFGPGRARPLGVPVGKKSTRSIRAWSWVSIKGFGSSGPLRGFSRRMRMSRRPWGGAMSTNPGYPKVLLSSTGAQIGDSGNRLASCYRASSRAFTSA